MFFLGTLDLPIRNRKVFSNQKQNDLDTNQLQEMCSLLNCQYYLASSYKMSVKSGWALEGVIIGLLLVLNAARFL